MTFNNIKFVKFAVLNQHQQHQHLQHSSIYICTFISEHEKYERLESKYFNWNSVISEADIIRYQDRFNRLNKYTPRYTDEKETAKCVHLRSCQLLK